MCLAGEKEQIYTCENINLKGDFTSQMLFCNVFIWTNTQTCIPTHELLTKPRRPAVTLQNSKTCPLHRAALDTNSKESMHCGQWEPYRILLLFLNISLKSLLLFHDQLVLISLHHI